ncbi:hypothetical protein K438DRAFT_1749321 [Mycena galopus ATCC 62051]|nr:hypothetical protein K438DRAFT_1749321 [Mycena galopus ATCC 62051]
MPIWDESYPALNDDEREELDNTKESYKTEIEDIKACNEHEVKSNGHRNAVLTPVPLPGPHLQELRTRGAGQKAIHKQAQKLKHWFSNAKTKDNNRKLEPFRMWLCSLATLHGAPQRIKLVGMLWCHEKHGESLCLLYRQKYKKDADTDDNADGADGFENKKGEENEDLDEGEDEGVAAQTKLMSVKYKITLPYFKGLTKEEQREADYLQHRHARIELISQCTLETLCTQMQCKGVLILGEIVDSDEEKMFLSIRVRWVTWGAALPPQRRPQRRPCERGRESAEEEDADTWLGQRSDGEDKDEEGQPAPPTPSTPGGSPLLELRHMPNTALRKKLAEMPTPCRQRTIWEFNTLSDSQFQRENWIAENEAALHLLMSKSLSEELGLGKKAGSESILDSGPPVSLQTRSSKHLAAQELPSKELMSAHGADSPPLLAAHAETLTTPAAPNPEGPNPLVDNEPAMEDVHTTGTVIKTVPDSSPKHQLILQTFRMAVEYPGWTAVVEAWHTLEEATGFEVGKALPATNRPEVVKWWVSRGRKDLCMPCKLDEAEKEDERKDFYEGVVKWWVGINPVWRKAGLVKTSSFVETGLKQESQGNLESLFSGLNAGWLAGIAEGAPAWRKLLEDIRWMLEEKHRSLACKRAASPSSEEPPAKHIHTE